MAPMKQAMRVIATMIAVLIAGVAVYLGFSGSWGAAILLFLLAGGVEFAAVALGAEDNAAPSDRNRGY